MPVDTDARHHTAPAVATSTPTHRPIDLLLPRLDRLQERGAGEWYASCPTSAHAYGDRSRGLHVSETGDGRVLLHCYAGCPVDDVVLALGLELGDLFPSEIRPSRGNGGPPRLSARDALELVRYEATVLACAAELLLDGTATVAEVERVRLAVDRIYTVTGGAR
jgi:hypothetical protein